MHLRIPSRKSVLLCVIAALCLGLGFAVVRSRESHEEPLPPLDQIQGVTFTWLRLTGRTWRDIEVPRDQIDLLLGNLYGAVRQDYIRKMESCGEMIIVESNGDSVHLDIYIAASSYIVFRVPDNQYFKACTYSEFDSSVEKALETTQPTQH